MQKQSLNKNRLAKTFLMGMTLVLVTSCNSNGDSAHTTATTYVPPPQHQVLKIEFRDGQRSQAKYETGANVDVNKPLLLFNLPDGKLVSTDEEVVIDFSLANATLKGDGGDFRVRYIIDDGEMQWLDRWQQVVLTGWTPGEHTIRIELVGPDGWPFRNGDFNVVTRKLVVRRTGGALSYRPPQTSRQSYRISHTTSKLPPPVTWHLSCG